MNPLDMMKFSGLWITTPDGETLETNLKVTASDLELIQQIKKMQ